VLAGVLVAYGAFALLAALVGAVAVAIGLDTELASNDWATLGRGSAATVRGCPASRGTSVAARR
jgi:hypothetical protein